MLKFILSLISIFLFINAFGQIQPQRADIHLENNENAITNNYAIPITNPQPFLSYAFAWDGAPLRIRFSENGSDWSDWQNIQEDEHAEQSAARHISELYFTNKKERFFQIAGNTDGAILHFYSPDSTPQASLQQPLEPRSGACLCAQPTYQNRVAWCPSGNCPPNPAPEFIEVTHLIVHHSAGTNEATDWAAVVRAIWDFHVNVNGWSDIAYNWLIDPNGVVYEGRGDGILGAHFCGHNSGTMGVCVLGDFTNIVPTAAAQSSLIKLLGWKACDRNIDPLGVSFHASSGLNLHNISGHRDGCSTECPGEMFYPLLDTIRQEVADYINTCSDVTSTEPMLQLEELRLYPNPAGDQLHLSFRNELTGRFEISIQNTIGKISKDFVIDKNQTNLQLATDIASLPAGIYFLKIRQARKAVMLKFVKK